MSTKTPKLWLSTALLIVGVTSCQKSTESSEITSTLFAELSPEQSGITFANDIIPTEDQNIIDYLYYYNGGGVAVGDLDNDGDEDLVLTANQGSNAIYRNEGGLRFRDVTTEVGMEMSRSWSTGVTIDDINNDGWKDIYICQVAPVSDNGTQNLLYLNNGDGTFSEVGQELGVDFSGYSTQASFFDYDRDGDLDMYLLNHSIHSTRSYGDIKRRSEPDALSGDRLYENRLNESEASFVDVTATSGIYSSAMGYGLGLVTSDLNGDGWIDIYVGNDFHDNDYFYLNNRDGTFSDVTQLWLTHSSQFTMGVDAADIDGDGRIDVYTTDMKPHEAEVYISAANEDSDQVVAIKKDFGFLPQYSRNTMQLNKGGHLIDVAPMTQTFATDWSWSGLIQDFDLDGESDVFVSNGILRRPNDLDYINFITGAENQQRDGESDVDYDRRLANLMPSRALSNILFVSQGDLNYTPVHEAKVGTPGFSNGAAYADFDNDGDLDLITNNLNGPATILANQVDSGVHYLGIELVDDSTAKGAFVTLYSGDRSWVREYTTTRGYQSASTHRLHFGIGESLRVDSILVKWPDGSSQLVDDLEVDQLMTITKEVDKGSSPLQASIDGPEIQVLSIRHEENPYMSFQQEPLMLDSYDAEGPATVLDDFDGDGIPDLFMGAARGQASALYLGTELGGYTKSIQRDLARDQKYEDVDAAAVDLDQDGDLDLYVVSGGGDRNQNDPLLEDRIYVNDGSGTLDRLQIPLPRTNGGAVAPGDYDGDGYVDLFIGGQSIPGAYGLTPISMILHNERGRGLRTVFQERLGMISDASWEDVDRDGRPELVAVGDWMSPRILTYEGDTTFVDLWASYMMKDLTGLYNCIEAGDIDGDGRSDLVIGNLGANTIFGDGKKADLTMYLDDFDGNTSLDPLVFHNYFGHPVPLFTKALLESQVPTIRKRYPRYSDWRSVDGITSVTGKQRSDITEIKNAQELRSIILLNRTDGMTSVALPMPAQLSSIEALYWDEQRSRLYYCGNTSSLNHVVGGPSGCSGGYFEDFNPKTKKFSSHTALPLPPDGEYRSIHKVNDRQLLITSTGNHQYLVDID
ncbi:MAG: VCBS repeat-containing protein [Bacteroidota bacterium]